MSTDPAQQSDEKVTRRMRYFIDTVEVSEDVAKRAEARGAAHVAQGGSGVVPEYLREPGETEAEWLCPWVLLTAKEATDA